MEEGDGNSAAARLLFKCALRVDSQNIFAWRSWEKLELNLGNNARAEEIRMQYLQQVSCIWALFIGESVHCFEEIITWKGKRKLQLIARLKNYMHIQTRKNENYN